MSQINLEQSFATFMETNTKTEQVVVCPICLDNISGSKNIVITECGHSFHCSCLMTNVSHNGFKCPYCRTKMCENDDSDSDDDDESTSTDESTDSVYTEIHEDDMLRGLRLFNNIINGEEHTEEDISEERFYEAYLEMVEQNNNGEDDESTIWEDTDDEGNDMEADDTILVNRYREQCYNGSRFHNPEYLDEEEEENEIIESNMLRGYRLFTNLINGDEHDESDINLESYYNINM